MEDDPVISWDDIRGASPDQPPAPPESPPATPPVSSEIPPAEPEATPPPAGDTPPVEPVEESSKQDKGRFRLEGPDAHFARLRKEGVTAEEAVKIAYAPKSPESSANGNPVDDLKAVDDELTEVRKKLDAFAEDESLYTKEVREAQKRESELVAKKDRIERTQQQRQAQVEQTEAQRFEDAETKSWEAATGQFEDIANPDSALAKAVKTEWDAIADNPKHPLYSLSDLPETLVAKHAARLGIAPKAATPPVTPPAPAPIQKPPAPGLQPVPASTGRTPPPVQITEAQKEAQSNAALANAGSEEELNALLGEDIFGKARERQGYAFR